MVFYRNYPLFVFLLPVFFVLHGVTENYNLVPFKDAIFLTGIYLASATFFLLLFRVAFKNWLKAALLSFLLMAFHFFFGAIHDTLKNLFPGSFITKYVFILTFSSVLLLLIIFVLKKTKKSLRQPVLYLNLLLLALLAIDGVWLISKITGSGKEESNYLSKEFIPCENCNRPDVYVIITDEYTGDKALRDLFHFDNTPFLNQLAKLGFHTVPFSSSNYNYTPYSVASALNMDYLDLQRPAGSPVLAYAYELIRNNRFLQFLQYHDYIFFNYSFFDFRGQPAHTQETFLPAKTRLITSQTFLSRLNKELRFNLVTRFNSKSELRRLTYGNRKNNETLFNLTLKTAAEKTKQPKFVLTHLMMPHYPYYYDKNGREYPFETLAEGQKINRQHYIEYLQYGNKKLLELLDHILKKSSSPPIIILMGDHGFRHFTEPVDPKYYFSNLVSVHLPGNNYTAFTDSLTNVNLLRTVLNVSFNQRLAYLKDTTIIMENP